MLENTRLSLVDFPAGNIHHHMAQHNYAAHHVLNHGALPGGPQLHILGGATPSGSVLVCEKQGVGGAQGGGGRQGRGWRSWGGACRDGYRVICTIPGWRSW